MTRLTNKVKVGNETYYCSQDNKVSLKSLYDKLGKLEDIEEELGCPLDVLFKAMWKGVWIYDEMMDKGHKHVWYSWDEFSIRFEEYEEWNKEKEEWELTDVCLVIGGDDSYSKLKDYGKTWWLDKPESKVEE